MLQKDVARNANWLEAEMDGKISNHEARMLFMVVELMICSTQFEEVCNRGDIPAVMGMAFYNTLFEGFRGIFCELLEHGKKGEAVMMSAVKTAAAHVQKEHEQYISDTVKRYREAHGDDLNRFINAMLKKGGA